MNPLIVERVTKRYGEQTAVNQIQFEVGPGEIFGLLGANGAGKTTTMRMVLGLIFPDEGRILWKGNGYSEGLRRLLGYLPEERGLYTKLKISDQLMYFAQLRGMNRRDAESSLKRWLERFGVAHFYDKKVEELSKGNQQKIQFIAAVIHDPEILILDEAFSGLDPVNVELLKDTVKQLRDEGKTIVFSSHRMEHVEELCENICILHRGNTRLQGNLKEIKRSFPKERLLLETEGSVKGIESISGVLDVKKDDRVYEVRIRSVEVSQEVLALALRQTKVYRFQLLEPTLNEIFIRAVGGEIR